jgi:hypothetical protein
MAVSADVPDWIARCDVTLPIDHAASGAAPPDRPDCAARRSAHVGAGRRGEVDAIGASRRTDASCIWPEKGPVPGLFGRRQTVNQ